MNSIEFRPPGHRIRAPRAGLIGLFIVIIGVVAASAIIHVATRNKTHALGRIQAEVEHEISSLQDDIRGLERLISSATDEPVLRERLAEARTKLREIPEGSEILIPKEGEPSPMP